MLDEARKFAERVWGPLESCTDLRERERVERELEDFLETWESPRIEELKGTISDLEYDLRSARSEVSDYETQVAGLEDDISNLKDDLRTAEDERDAANEERDELATQLEELRASHAEDDRGEVA